ncbi:proteasome assembly chaperone 2 [Aethina tumida]|uniref:proteasome assembly chaperone 2 n=1 Tax=Aethina tumida TaxID=116153 RepID=UPI00096AFC5C|nr:proteasome assembly chaperone 2 [Aethina tumida]
MVTLFNKENNLNDHTLIIPSVSVGNAPQLCVDLIIATFGLKKIANIWHPAIISTVGSDPYADNCTELCTACELYSNDESKISVIQLRSSLEHKLASTFFKDLKSSLESFNLKRIVLLGSGFDYELRTVSNHKFYYTSNENIQKLMEDNRIKQLQENLNGKIVIHGDGFTGILYKILNDKFKTTALVKYVSEGDNIPDAVSMLETICAIYKINHPQLKIPSSWKYLFGGPPPIGIF